MSRRPQPWRAAPLLRASALWHGGALVLTLWQWRWWPWTLAAVLANQLLLTAWGLSPRSRALGSNWTRLPQQRDSGDDTGGHVAITIDDGPDPQVTPRVLQILARYGAHATFFCIGERAARHPALLHQCTAAGHGVENHSQHHIRLFALLGPRRLTREIEQAQRVIAHASGAPPRFFRAPAGLRSPWLDPLLQRCGLQLASWTRRGFDSIDGDAGRVLARLTRNLRSGDILLLHDGHAARNRRGEAVILEVLPQLLEELGRRGLTPVTLRELLRT
jgi:peptidoglycan/xylan/chitin deacetylase (PgdA/CDA1 family)